METSPFNERLHKYLTLHNYTYTEHTRYDRYDKGDITIFYYLNGYVMILEGGEPASKEVVKEIERAL